ncbi:hypothetical protein YC2023_084267 [Brassica napus]
MTPCKMVKKWLKVNSKEGYHQINHKLNRRTEKAIKQETWWEMKRKIIKEPWWEMMERGEIETERDTCVKD